MASKGFKLTDSQKEAASRLYQRGNLDFVNKATVKALFNKGVITVDDELKMAMSLPCKYSFNPEWQAWADVQFGLCDPTPDPDGSDEITSTPAPVASEPVADTASKAYSARQLQIINHFQKVYYQFGRNADTYSILVWTSADTDFIYPQEVAELIEDGCEYFSVVYPKHTNMWTVPNYQINKAIASYIAPGASGHVISGHVISGHGRKSRNRKRSNQGQNKAHSSHKVSSSVNIEKNTAKAQNWRNMRNLHNATAMPIPTITGAELLARGQQLTVVPKPKQMTRILEAA